MSVRLGRFVDEWVAEKLIRPADASKPEELQALRDAVRKDWGDAFAAEHAPVAPLTWEQQALLHVNDPETERTRFNFPYRQEVVGMRASISVIHPVAQGLIIPTLDDIQVAIDINETEDLTKLDGQQTTAASTKRGGNFVTLGSISVQAPRLFGLKLISPKPDLGMTFRWKQLGVFADCLVAVALYVRDIDHREGANVEAQYER